MEVKTLAYAAGIIDGEGHIGAHKNCGTNMKLTIEVHMKYSKVPNWLEENIGGKVRIRKDQTYIWTMRASDSISFIENIKPYLIEKKDQAEVYLQLYDLKQLYKKQNQYSAPVPPRIASAKEKLYQELKSLHN